MYNHQSQLAFAITISFLVGSIPFGWLIAKLWGISDLRTKGSTNIGATNVVRTAGIVPGALTFLLDFGKGLAPLLYFNAEFPASPLWLGLAAIIGHCFTPFLKFKGGKGVSTALGAICGLNPWLGFTTIFVYLNTLAITRISAMGSLFAMLTALAGTLIYIPESSSKIAIVFIVYVVLTRHDKNWTGLLSRNLIIFFILLLPFNEIDASCAIKDFRDKTVEVTEPPKRVVALIPSLAETVIDLGSGKQLVGAPDYSQIPSEFSSVKKLGPYNSLSIEAIYALHPDVVLASMDGNDPNLVSRLEKLGLKVITVNTLSIHDILRSVEIVATALGNPTNPTIEKLRVALSPKSKVDAAGLRPLTANTKKKVFIQVGWNPLVTIGHQTFISELVGLTGGINIFDDAKSTYPRPNAEEVIARNPDIIIICKLTTDGSEVEQSKQFWARFKKISAIKSGKVFVMPGDWLTKPGFTLIRGVEELKKVL